MMQPRETIYSALWNLILAGLMVQPTRQGSTAVWLPGATPTAAKPIAWASRRWIPYSRADIQPALLLHETAEAQERTEFGVPPRIRMNSQFIIYARDGVDPNAISAITLNGLMDTVDAAMAPPGYSDEQTLSAFNVAQPGQPLVTYSRVLGGAAVKIGDPTADTVQSILWFEVETLGTV